MLEEHVSILLLDSAVYHSFMQKYEQHERETERGEGELKEFI